MREECQRTLIAYLRLQHQPRRLQILRRIDAQGDGFDDGDVDAHAERQGPQLFEAFALLQRRGWGGYETLERFSL